MKHYFNDFLLMSTVLAFTLFTSGCFQSVGYSIGVKNNSGVQLKEVGIANGGKQFGLGVLVDGGISSYETAENRFGKTLPKSMDVCFTSPNGIPILVESITLPRLSANRSIIITIDSKFEATATNGHK